MSQRWQEASLCHTCHIWQDVLRRWYSANPCHTCHIWQDVLRRWFSANPSHTCHIWQDVLRRWFSANPAILSNVAGLVANAADMEAALIDADVVRVGACLDTYW